MANPLTDFSVSPCDCRLRVRCLPSTVVSSCWRRTWSVRKNVWPPPRPSSPRPRNWLTSLNGNLGIIILQRSTWHGQSTGQIAGGPGFDSPNSLTFLRVYELNGQVLNSSSPVWILSAVYCPSAGSLLDNW